MRQRVHTGNNNSKPNMCLW